jgi:riboflavin-specific deaminase-like protein
MQGTIGHDPLHAIRDAPRGRSFVVAQLGQSLDGRIATLTGESRWINKEAALDHVHRLRAAVDAVVVGVGTVCADDPLLNVRRVKGPDPARVVLDPAGRVPVGARCLAPGPARRIVVGPARPDLPVCVECLTLPREDGRVDPCRVVSALAERGLRRLLIEGGAWTVSAFIDAGVVDRLHVLVAPIILGSGKTGLALKPIARLTDARRPPTSVHVLADGDVLFDCDLSAPRGGDDADRR